VQLVVSTRKLITLVDKEIDNSRQEIEYKTDEGLKPWFIEYNIWKETSEDKTNSIK